jgi:hypothetical protein
LIAEVAFTAPRFPVGRVLRLIKSIVHLFTYDLDMVASESFRNPAKTSLFLETSSQPGWMIPAETLSCEIFFF